MTRTERVRDLLATTARLIACMDQEIKLLRAMRPQEIQLIQVDKLALADAYEAHFMALRDGKDEGDAVSDALLAELSAATERFQTVLADNARALRAVRDVNDRVLKAVVEAVERNRVEPAGYTRGGKAPAPRRRAAPAPAMAVNQQF
jgi:hypothetical protein